MQSVRADPGDVSWDQVSGSDLAELFQSGDSLEILLPRVAAIYMWKLRLADDRLVVQNPRQTLRQLIKLATTPQGRTRALSASHGLVSMGVELCGGGLPTPKVQALGKFLEQPKNNRWMINYLRNLEQHLPALYVGESGNLPKRIREHLSGSTDFGQIVVNEPRLDWRGLNLYYMSMGPPAQSDNPVRKSMEYLTAVLTVSAFTQRPG
jgi:hypothetical protein